MSQFSDPRYDFIFEMDLQAVWHDDTTTTADVSISTLALSLRDTTMGQDFARGIMAQ